MNQLPLVTVIMPLYNTEKFLNEAIDSILQQTFRDFEFIIIDDASTDSSIKIVQSYTDPRIVFVEKKQNTGYTESLNMGLQMATGKYIARMDSDDIAILTRFKKQVEVLNANPDIAVCGTWFQLMGDDNRIIKHPAHFDEVKVAMLQYCAIGHPTAMVRKAVLDKHQLSYDSCFEPAEDYQLWTQISNVAKLSNIPEVLLKYRLHEGQVSTLRTNKQIEISNNIRILQLKHFDISPNAYQRALHLALVSIDKQEMLKYEAKQVHEWLMLLYNCNIIKKYYDLDWLTVYLTNYWYCYIILNKKFSRTILKLDISSKISIRVRISKSKYFKFLLKCIFCIK